MKGSVFFTWLGVGFLTALVAAILLHAPTAVLLALALLALVRLLAVIFAPDSLAARLQRVASFAQKIGGGELDARIAEAGDDELAGATEELDRAAAKLEQSFARLEERRKELETLLNGIQDCVIAISAESRVQWSNHSLSALLKREVPPGTALLQAIRDPEVVNTIKAALESRQVQTGRTRALAPNRIFSVSVAPMPSGGVVAVLHDQTQIENMDQTRRDFIANVSHELRTPLTSIRGYAETLLEMPEIAEGARGFLRVIHKNAERMSRLAEDLLALAQVESGEVKMQPSPAPASALLREAAQNFRGAAQSKGVALVIAESSDQKVLANPEAIHQAFSNLIGNAIKYGSGGERIEIGCHEAGDEMEFFTRDFGQGIASEHLPRLFERFYRVDKARSAESGGTGLGLAIVKHLVLNLGGRVRVESELHHGTTFYFTLPLAGEKSDAPAEAEEHSSELPQQLQS